ncbi:MAG TPA: hypothetical protein VNB29_07115 [Chthoniobacterales bacterium]|nr:hypothetical protein [Chthoniobacterales bacterium]
MIIFLPILLAPFAFGISAMMLLRSFKDLWNEKTATALQGISTVSIVGYVAGLIFAGLMEKWDFFPSMDIGKLFICVVGAGVGLSLFAMLAAALGTIIVVFGSSGKIADNNPTNEH